MTTKTRKPRKSKKAEVAQAAPAPKKTYEWADHYDGKVPAQVAGTEITRISEKYGGGVTPQAVVDESKPRDAPLHPVFEWRDEVAANEHRKDQASRTIRSIRVVVVEDERIVSKPAFVSVTVVDEDEDNAGHYKKRRYEPADEAMADQDKSKQVLADALAMLRGIQKRYRDLSALAPVWAALDAVDVPE